MGYEEDRANKVKKPSASEVGLYFMYLYAFLHLLKVLFFINLKEDNESLIPDQAKGLKVTSCSVLVVDFPHS